VEHGIGDDADDRAEGQELEGHGSLLPIFSIYGLSKSGRSEEIFSTAVIALNIGKMNDIVLKRLAPARLLSGRCRHPSQQVKG